MVLLIKLSIYLSIYLCTCVSMLSSLLHYCYNYLFLTVLEMVKINGFQRTWARKGGSLSSYRDFRHISFNFGLPPLSNSFACGFSLLSDKSNVKKARALSKKSLINTIWWPNHGSNGQMAGVDKPKNCFQLPLLVRCTCVNIWVTLS